MAYGTYDKYVMDDTCCDELLAAPVAAISITAPAANQRVYSLKEPTAVTRFGVQIVSAITYGPSPTLARVTLFKRVVHGSDTNRVNLGSFEIPAAAIGSVLFVDVRTIDGRGLCRAGEQIVMAVTVLGSSTAPTPTGSYRPFFCFNPMAEVADNQSFIRRPTDLTP